MKRMLKLALMLVLLGTAVAATLTICPDHGVKSGFTGNRKTVFNGSKRTDFCEYSHPLKDLSGVHKFWTQCED